MTAGWAWLLIFGFIISFELWAGYYHHQTLSQWMWMMEHKFIWFKYIISIFVIALILHLFLIKWP